MSSPNKNNILRPIAHISDEKSIKCPKLLLILLISGGKKYNVKEQDDEHDDDEDDNNDKAKKAKKDDVKKNGKEKIDINPVVTEAMTDSQKERREEIVKNLKKKTEDFKKKYGDRWEDVMYATATKMALRASSK